MAADMRHGCSVMKIAGAFAFFMLLTPIFASAQVISSVETSGTCGDFVIIVAGDELGESCWDVKLDIPGEVYDERSSKWMSGFFYIEKAICYPDKMDTIMIKLGSKEPVIDATAKIRQGSVIVEKDFVIRQSCSQPVSESWVLIISVAIIVIFGWGLAWWWKGSS